MQKLKELFLELPPPIQTALFFGAIAAVAYAISVVIKRIGKLF